MGDSETLWGAALWRFHCRYQRGRSDGGSVGKEIFVSCCLDGYIVRLIDPEDLGLRGKRTEE